ncbi:hypothetical protein Sjap_019765 [Stephania japonica]|uniref:Cytochrome P450 n=1 Tax=Stephania japonica TaxID=461633 RepID=A0AAP0HZN7_9MAGN
MVVNGVVGFVSAYLCLYLLTYVIRFLYDLWWKPLRIQRALRSQGLGGHSYKFPHGNTKEISKMIGESMAKPMELLSHDVFAMTLPHLQSWINKFGKNFFYWHSSKPQLVISEPELIKEILNNKEGVFQKIELQGFFKKLLGDGLVTVEGQKWITQRKIANHSFHADSLKGMVQAMSDSVDAMLERWSNIEGKEIEVFQEYRQLTADVIARTAFGSSFLEGKNIFDMLTKLSILAGANSYKTKIPGIGKFFKDSDEIESEKLEQNIRDSIIEVIRERKEKMKSGETNTDGCYFLESLIKANEENDECKRISIDDVIDECKTFYFAGHETTTSLLTWTSLLLATNQDWQDEARQEAIKLLDKKTTSIEFYNHIARSKMLNMIFNETLRLYTPASIMVRRVAKKTRLGKLVIPSGTDVLIPTLFVHHDPDIWGEDVNLFKPERFSKGVANANATNSTNSNTSALTFFPFGYGPRTCVGLNFALLEAKIALVAILQRYHFTLSPTYVHSPFFNVTIHPQHGLQLELHAL